MNRLPFGKSRFALCLTLLLAFPTIVSAATLDFQVLLDVDNSAATGCSVSGMAGVEQVILTSVTTTESTGSVTATSRRVCTGGVLGAPVDITGGGYGIGFNPASGQMVVESRVAYAALGNDPFTMRVGFTGQTGTSTSSVLTRTNGQPILFPEAAHGRRRSATPGNLDERVLNLDGQTGDWGMIPPLASNNAAGQQVFRLSQIYGYGDGQFFWFRVDANLSKNPPPQANDDAYSIRQGQVLVIAAPGVLANDTDPQNLPLAASIVTQPTHGVLSLNSSGAFTYANDGVFVASDFFEYRASNGLQDSNRAKVVITILPNGVPQAVPDAYNVAHRGTLTIPAPGILANDSDPDGDPLAALGLGLPANGTLNFNASGAFTYTHNGSNTLSDTFSYVATDSFSQSSPTQVNITVAADIAPTAVADAYSVAEGGTLTVAATGLFSNDTDPDTPISLWTAQVVTPPANGGLTIGAGGAFTYVHNGSETTSDSFVYRVNDGIANSGNATVTITVTPVNDPPVAVNDGYTTNEDTPLTVPANGVLANDTDAEGQALTAALVTNGANGNAVINANGGFTYTPNANFNGSNSFTYTATDAGSAISNTATVTVTVTAVNDAPSFTAGPGVTVGEDSGAYSAAWATAVSAGPADEAAQTLTFNVSNNNNGLFSAQPAVAANGTLTFTPAVNANGSATIMVSLSDSGSNAAPNVNTSASINFTITVNAVNDAPSFTKGANQTMNEDAAAQTVNGWATGISAGPADEAGQVLAFNANNDNNALFSVQPAVSAAGVLIYTPALNANGVANVTLTLSDNGSGVVPNVNTSAAQQFVITINAVNDAPVNTVPAAVQNINEDVPLVFSTGNANAISVADVDAGSAPFRATITATNGTATAAAGSGATLTGDGTATLIINGTLAQVNLALAGLTYTPTPNYSGAAQVQILSSDLGAAGSGGTLTDTDVVTINITAVNDAPVFTTGGNLTVNEDGAAYNAAWATAIGPGGGADEAGQTLTFTVNNDNNGLFSVQPALASNGTLTFTLAANAFGVANVTVTLGDNGGVANGGVDTSAQVNFTITVTAVNDVPSFTKGADQTVLEDSGLNTVAGWATAISAGPSEGSQLVDFIVSNNNNALFSVQPAVAADGTLTYTLAANANGSAVVTIAIHDDGGIANGGVDTSANQTFNITVTAVNDAPSFTKGADQTVLEDSGLHTVAGWATALSAGPADESGQTLSFNVSNDNNGLFSTQPAVAANGTLTYTLAANAFGSTTVTVSISDNGGVLNGGVDTSANQTFTITVTDVNDVPSFTKGADQTVLEDSGLNTVAGWATAISAGPSEGSQVVDFIVSNNNNALFSVQPAVAADGTLTYTLAANANGSAVVTIAIHDDGGVLNGGVDTSANQTFNITVTAVNDAPSFTKGADQTVLEDSGLHTVAGWATALSAGPADESGQTLSFNVSNDNNGLFSTQPAVAANGTLTYTLAANANGSTTVTVSISDNGGVLNGGVDTSANQTFTITVTDVNDVPSFTKGADQTVLEDSGLNTVAGWATAISAGPSEGSQLVDFIVSNNNNALFSVQPAVAADGTLTYTLAANANGSAVVTIAIHDDGGVLNGGVDTSANQTFNITVTAVNDAPSFTKGADQTVLEDSGLHTVAGWATALSAGPADESGQTLSFNVSNDNNALFSTQPAVAANGTLTYTLAANANGSTTVTVSLSDNGGVLNGGADTSANQTFTITVTDVNDVPSFTKGADQTVLEDSGLLHTVAGWATAISAGPSEGSQIVDFIVSNNDNALFTVQPAVAANGTLTYTLAANANGSAVVTIAIHDNGGISNSGVDTSANQTFNITVTAVNDAPSFTKGADQSVLEDSGLHTVAGWATALSAGPADESGQTLSFNVSNDNNALFSTQPAVAANGTLTYTLAANAFGSTTVTISLSDNGGVLNGGADTSANQTFTITVNAVNDVPSFTKGADESVNEDSGLLHTVAGWATAISAGPGEGSQVVNFIVSNNNNGLFSVQPAVAANGTLTYTLAVNANGSAVVTIAIHDDGGVLNGGVDTSANQTFNITVNAVNDPPTFVIASDPPFILAGAAAQTVNTFATSISPGGGADEAAQALTFSVSPTGTTGTLTFAVAPAINSSTGNLIYTPTPGTNGTATFSVTLSDNGGGTDTSGAQSFTIAVEVAPTVTTTTPVDNASGVSTSTNITVNFSEPIGVLSTAAFKINCNAGPDLGYAFVGGTTNVSTITLDPTSALPAGNCVVTVVAVEIHDTDPYDPPDGLAVDYVFDFVTNTPPTAVDDTDNALGNTALVVADADGVLVNGVDGSGADSDPDAGAILTIQSLGPFPTSQGGTITFTSGGGYTYSAQAGDQNVADTVNYTVTDQFGGTDVGQLTINVGPRYIYIDDVGAAGDGRDISPFQSITLAQAGAGQTQAVAGDTLVVKSGNYTDAATLKNTQVILGQGISANHVVVFNTENFTVLTAGVAPTLTTAAGNAITLAASNTIRGMAINPAAGKGVIGTGFTAVTINESSINATGGAALDLTTGAATITLTSTTSTNSTALGVNLNAISGSVALGTGTISGAATTGFLATGSNSVITYAGNITSSAAGGAVSITSRTGGSVALSGNLTSNTSAVSINVANNTGGTLTFSGGAQNITSSGASNAVNLATNAGTTINFTGGALVINSATGMGFTATGNATAVNVTGANNTVTSVGGIAVEINATPIGASGVTWKSVSANGGANGIVLTSPGANAFTVTGTGVTAASGGTIQNTTGAAVSITTGGSTSLSNMTVTATSTDGITGTTFGTLTVAGISLAASRNALALTTGTVNGTFTAINCTPSGNQVPVTLNAVGGNFAVVGGAIGSGGGGGTPDVFDVIGGNATIVWNGTMGQSKASELVDISGGHTGNITFGGNLTATTGTGMLFDNADGVYTISGAANAFTGGAGVNITNNSSGTYSFNSGTSITNGLVGANTACLTVNGSNLTSLTYSGNLTKNAAIAGRLLDLTNIANTAGTFTFQTGTLSTASTSPTSTGILLSNVDNTVNFSGTTTLNGAGGDAGVDISGGSIGAITFNASTQIGNTNSPSGTAFDISNANVQTTVTYNGTINSSGTSRPVSVQSVGANSVISFTGNITSTGNGILLATMGNPTSVTFSGASKNLNIGANPSAVSYTGAAGNTVTFSGGGLVISRTTGAGIAASGGGTLIVTGTGNIINSGTSGTALSVNGVTIGAGGLLFQSISQNGGSNGVFLQNTGSTAGLTIAGNSAGNCGGKADTNTADVRVWSAIAANAADCTGGTIQNTTGVDGATAGVGIYLNNTQKVSLTRVKVNDHQNYGIQITDVTGFTADNLFITGTNGTNGTNDEGGIWINDLSGTTAASTNASITNSTIEGAFEHNVWMVNSGSTVLNRITFDNVTIGANLLASGDKGIGVEVAGTSATSVTVDNCRFTSARGDMFNLTVQGAGGNADLILDNTEFNNTHGNIVGGGGGVLVNVGESGDLTYSITNNLFRGAKGVGLGVQKLFGGAPGNGTASGTIANNHIGVTGVVGSGSSEASGIIITLLGAGSHTSLITNNQIRGYHNYGIYLFVGGSAESTTGITHNGTYHVTVQSNNIAEPTNTWTFPQYGIHLRGGTNSPDSYSMCVDIGHDTNAALRNTLDGAGGTVGASTGEDMFIWPRFSTTIRLPNYGGASNGDAAVVTYLKNRNNNSGATSVLVLRQNTAGWTGGAACTLP